MKYDMRMHQVHVFELVEKDFCVDFACGDRVPRRVEWDPMRVKVSSALHWRFSTTMTPSRSEQAAHLAWSSRKTRVGLLPGRFLGTGGGLLFLAPNLLRTIEAFFPKGVQIPPGSTMGGGIYL